MIINQVSGGSGEDENLICFLESSSNGYITSNLCNVGSVGALSTGSTIQGYAYRSSYDTGSTKVDEIEVSQDAKFASMGLYIGNGISQANTAKCQRYDSQDFVCYNEASSSVYVGSASNTRYKDISEFPTTPSVMKISFHERSVGIGFESYNSKVVLKNLFVFGTRATSKNLLPLCDVEFVATYSKPGQSNISNFKLLKFHTLDDTELDSIKAPASNTMSLFVGSCTRALKG